MRFLDAIPAGRPVVVTIDVLTPHVKPYYDAIAQGSDTPPAPAEYHNPVPVNFLTVSGAFAIDVYGANADHVDQAVSWLADAADQLGAGAKTAAGYGYLTLSPRPEREG